jgi:hypothetical protein
MAREAGSTRLGNRLFVLKRNACWFMRMAANTLHGARIGKRGMAVTTLGSAMRTKTKRKTKVVILGRRQRLCERSANNRNKRSRHYRWCPRKCAMALVAVARKGRRRCGALMHGTQTRAPVLIFMTGKTVYRHAGPKMLACFLVTLRAICKHVHTGKGKAGHTVNFNRLRSFPGDSGMALVARRAQAATMPICVATYAITFWGWAVRHMTCRAPCVGMYTGEWKAGFRMVKSVGVVTPASRAGLPSGRRVTRTACEPRGHIVLSNIFICCCCDRAHGRRRSKRSARV